MAKLFRRGFPIFDVPALHAKVIIVEDRFASIGSQNLTAKGVTNREATVAVSGRSDVARVVKFVQPWLAARTAVTGETLADLERRVPVLAKEFSRVRRHAAQVESDVWKAAERRSLEAAAVKVRTELADLVGTSDISKEAARRFIRLSTWWLTHRDGPVRARRFADHVYSSTGDWRLTLGANTFLVGRAIQRCRRTIESVADEAVSGNAITRQELVRQMELNVRGAVENFQGDEYTGYYPTDEDNRMRFGAQAIDVNDFVEGFLRTLSLQPLVSDSSG